MKQPELSEVTLSNPKPFRPRLGAASLKPTGAAACAGTYIAFRPRLGAASLKRRGPNLRVLPQSRPSAPVWGRPH